MFWPIIIIVGILAVVAIAAMIITHGEFNNQGMLWIAIAMVLLSLITGVMHCGAKSEQSTSEVNIKCIEKNGQMVKKAIVVPDHEPQYYSTCVLPGSTVQNSKTKN